MKYGKIILAAAMITAVTASNFLVEIVINEWLTWGAFSYPITFSISELANYYYGPKVARRIVYAAFICACGLSLAFAHAQIALASGLAFLIGQLLDISVFSRLRRKAWWIPAISASALGSLVDTAIFFSIAFWGQGLLILTLGAGDLVSKLAMDLILLLPFRLLLWRRPQSVFA